MFTFSRVLTGPPELSAGAVATLPLSRPPGSGPPRTAAPRQKAFCSERSLLRSGSVGGAGGRLCRYDDGQVDARAPVMPGCRGNRHTVRLPL